MEKEKKKKQKKGVGESAEQILNPYNESVEGDNTNNLPPQNLTPLKNPNKRSIVK